MLSCDGMPAAGRCQPDEPLTAWGGKPVTASNEKRRKRYAGDPEHREHRLACSRASYAAHKEKRSEYMRAYYLAHRDEIIARMRSNERPASSNRRIPGSRAQADSSVCMGYRLRTTRPCSRGRAAPARSASDPGYRCAWIIATSPAGCAACSVATATRRSVSCGTIRAWRRRRAPISGRPRVLRAAVARAAPAPLAAPTRRSARPPGAL
jgi:hypothetical protein